MHMLALLLLASAYPAAHDSTPFMANVKRMLGAQIKGRLLYSPGDSVCF
jgi:hypothetical protein